MPPTEWYSTLEKLVSLVSENAAFYELPESDIRMLVEHMIGKEYLEILAGTQELIVGLEGERLLRQRFLLRLYDSRSL